MMPRDSDRLDDCNSFISYLGRSPSIAAIRRTIVDSSVSHCVTSALLSGVIPDNVRSNLCRVVAEIRMVEALPALLHLTTAESIELRDAAIEAIGVLGDESVGSDLLAILNHDQPEKIKTSVLLTLALLPFPPSWLKIASYLNDPSERVRYRAAKALRYLAEPHSLDALRDAYRHEDSQWVKDEIGRAIYGITVEQDASLHDQLLLHAIRRHPKEDVRLMALRSLSTRMDEPAAWLGILTADRDRSARVRAAAVRLMAQLETDEAIRHLRMAQDDPDEEVRRIAEAALRVTAAQ